MSKAEVLTYMREHAPGACPIVAGSAGTNELTPHSGVDGSDLEIAVVGWLSALRIARRVRQTYPEVETYFVAPWRMRWGLQRNLGVARPNLPAFDLARQERAAPLPWGSSPPRLWRASELTAREAMTLMGNRIAVHLEKQTPYTAVKLAVAAADAVLIQRGLYELGYARRKEQFARIAGTLPSVLASTGLAGYEAKLTGLFDEFPNEQLSSAVSAAFGVVSQGITGGTAEQAMTGQRSVSDILRNAWRIDAQAAGWGPLSLLSDRLMSVIRGSKTLGPVRSARLVAAAGHIDAAIYANLIATFTGRKLLEPGEPGPWGRLGDQSLPLWWAYCA